MVDEVPVARADEPDVRLQDDHPTARAEQRGRDAQLFDDRVARLQVLQVVAHEHGPEVAPSGRAMARSSPDPWTKRTSGGSESAHVADVGRPPLGRDDPADEMAAIASQVEDRRVWVDVPPAGSATISRHTASLALTSRSSKRAS